MSDLNTEIKIGADASGVEAGVGKAKRSLASLGDTAKKAGQDAAAGLSGIGTGGDASAKKVESATRSMQASLQRLVAEQKAGSKSSREYWEALANARGVNQSAIKPLLDQLDAAKTKTIEAKTASEGWTASLGKVGPVLAAAFSGAAVLNFTGKLVAVQREFDVLNSSLITVTGSSAKAAREMEWIRKFAATTPYQLSEVTQAFVKMKALGLDASEASLRSYGNTASAMGKNINQMIEAVADAATGEFERLKEFGIKASKDGEQVSLTFRGMTTTIGNSAEEITRYLKQIGDVDFASAMDERAKTLDGAISNLADSWANLQLAISQGGVGGAIANESRAISNDLSAIADAMTASAAKGEGAFMQLANAAGVVAGRSAFGALELVANATNGSLNFLSGGILSLNTNLDLLPDNLRPVSVQMDLMGKKLDQARGEYDKLAARLAQAPDNIYIKSELNQLDQYIQKLEEATRKQRLMQGALASIDGLDFSAESAKFARQGIVPKAPEAGKQPRAGGSRSSAADAAAREVAEQSKLLAELSGLTASFSADWDRLSAIYAKGQLSLEGLTDAQAKLLEKQPFAVALAREETAAQQALAKAREADAKAYEDTLNGRINAAASVGEQVAREREAIQTMGLTRTAVAELEAAKLSDAAASQLRLAAIADEIDWSGRLGDTYREEAARLQELAGLKRAGAAKQQGIDAAKEAADAWQKTADSIESSLTDALMRGFEGGKSFGENFADSLVNTFKTYVARELAASISKALMSTFSGQGGWASALANAFTGGGGGGAGGSIMNMFVSAAMKYVASAASTTAAGSYAVTASGYTYGTGVATQQSMMLAAQEYGMTSAASSAAASEAAAAAAASSEVAAASAASAATEASAAAAATETAAAGSGAGASGAAAYAGWAALIVAAVVAAENLYSAGYNRQALTSAGVPQQQYGNNSFTSGRGQGESDVYNASLEKLTRNAFDFLGVSDKWADILSGTTRMATLFGRKLKAYGFDVDISGANVDVAGYEYHKGGLFRSNKTIATEVDPGDAQAVREMVLGTRDAAIEAAEAMGLSTHAIESFTGELKINMKGVNDAAEAQRRYTEALGQMYDDMIQQAKRVTFGEKMAEQVELLRDSARNMAAAMGLGTEGVDAYAGTLEVTMEQMDGSTAAAERLAKASEDLYWQMLQAADGFTMTKDEFKAMMESVRANIEAAGITSQGIGSTLAQGAIGRMDESQVGEALSESIIGGIYNTIANNAMAPVAEAFMGQIITPIFTAIMAGVPISQAVSQAAIDNVVASAQRAAEVLNTVFANVEFQAAIAGIQGAIGSIARISVSSASHVRSYGSAVSAAAQKAQAAAQERYGLETQLLNLLGNTTKLRERELNALDAGNRALQTRIWSVEDAKTGMEGAMEALERAIDSARNAAQTRLEAARETEQRLNDIFSTLRDNVRELRGEVDATNTLQAAAARALLRSAISSGVAPDTDTLRDAIDAARAGVADSGQYASQLDRDRATLSLASELERLQAIVQPQLSEAERTVQLLEAQIETLDLQLQTATDQMNALLGIDTSVKTVTEAVNALSAAMAIYAQVMASAASVSVGSAPPVNAVAPAPSYSAPAPAPRVWSAGGYASKNPDLVAHYNDNHTRKGWPSNLNSLGAYLSWHWQTYGQSERRQFAKGGFYPGGMALVGEEGPELINFRQPGQVYTAGQTAEILRGQGSSDDLVRELRALREEQRAQAAAMVQMQQKLHKIVGRWDTAGLPEERVTA